MSNAFYVQRNDVVRLQHLTTEASEWFLRTECPKKAMRAVTKSSTLRRRRLLLSGSFSKLICRAKCFHITLETSEAI